MVLQYEGYYIQSRLRIPKISLAYIQDFWHEVALISLMFDWLRGKIYIGYRPIFVTVQATTFTVLL